MKPRTIYPNRIAYLIATKRNTLKRLALRGAAHTERRVKSAKFGSRKMSARITRKGNGKRPGRLGLVGSKVFFLFIYFEQLTILQCRRLHFSELPKTISRQSQ